MKSKRLVILLGTICMVLMLGVTPLVGACAKPAPAPAPAPTPVPAPAPKPAAPIVLKAISFTPLTSKTDMRSRFEYLIGKINERAKGELTIQLVGGPEAIPRGEQPMALKTRVVDMALQDSAFYATLVPAANLLAFSEFPSAEERESKAYDFLVAEHKKANFFYLGRVPHDWKLKVVLLRAYRPKTPYDLAGLRCASFGPNWAISVADVLRMSFIVVPGPDIYTAFERGMIDAFVFPELGSAAVFKTQETVKYAIDHSFLRETAVFLFNLDTWNGLPKHLQTLIRDAYVEAEPEILRMGEEDQKLSRKKFLDAGVEFIKFSPADAEWFTNQIERRETERIGKLYPDIAPMIEIFKK